MGKTLFPLRVTGPHMALDEPCAGAAGVRSATASTSVVRSACVRGGLLRRRARIGTASALLLIASLDEPTRPAVERRNPPDGRTHSISELVASEPQTRLELARVMV